MRTATNSVPSGAAAIPVGSSQPIPPFTDSHRGDEIDRQERGAVATLDGVAAGVVGGHVQRRAGDGSEADRVSVSQYPSKRSLARQRGGHVVAIHMARGEFVQRRAGRHQRRGLALDGRLEFLDRKARCGQAR